MTYGALLDRHPIITDQIKRPALGVVLRELERTLDREVPGSVAEFGCYRGTTTLFLRRVLDAQASDKLLYAYDSFEGLPAKTSHDDSGAGEQFQVGELSVSKKIFLREFHNANLKPPLTVKGWFGDLKAEQLPPVISFAFLDGDFYQSILDCLRLVWPRLAPGGVIVIDDYQRDALPGPERAVRDYFDGRPPSVHHEHNIAILEKT
ncbi:MAG: TylF/MycF/NovP-related O-methyltransferase [Candidatus Saccharimonadales bacterium]